MLNMSTKIQEPFFQEVEQEWFSHEEGQLSVDVIETHDALIVRSAIAGVDADDLDIALTNDTLTIRGKRQENICYEEGVIHVKECHFGTFSRSIVLPCSVNTEEVDAVLQRGILTITLKKMESQTHISVLDLED